MSLFELHGKNALVTGASSGIGKQVALAYAQAGAAVAIAARHQEPLQELAAEIVAGGGTAVPITCDVTQPESVATMLARSCPKSGSLTPNERCTTRLVSPIFLPTIRSPKARRRLMTCSWIW